MFTVEIFNSIASEAENIMNARIAAGFGPGTVDQIRNDARRKMELANFCAKKMDEEGITESAHFGPFYSFVVNNGQKVRLKAGAFITSTHPEYRNTGKINPRNRIITVHSMHEGFANPHAHRKDPELRHPSITWVGTGGYWFFTDMNYIEPI